MRKAQAATRDPRERYVAILDQLCEQGRLGRKAGAGYYRYIDGKRVPTSDETVRAIIRASQCARGIQRQPLTPEQIQRLALLAMVNEAALLLQKAWRNAPATSTSCWCRATASRAGKAARCSGPGAGPRPA